MAGREAAGALCRRRISGVAANAAPTGWTNEVLGEDGAASERLTGCPSAPSHA